MPAIIFMGTSRRETVTDLLLLKKINNQKIKQTESPKPEQNTKNPVRYKE